MVDFTTYQPPGVYVEDTTGPVVTATGVPLPLVAVVGPARGFQIATQAVPLQDAETQEGVLLYTGVWLDPNAVGAPSGVKAPVVKNVGGQLLEADTDYVLAVDSTNGTGAAASVIVTRGPDVGTTGATANGVKVGDVVFVTYHYTDTSYYTPLLFEDFDLIEDAYGEALLTERPTALNASQIVSPLSLGARLVLDNGASAVICVPTDPTAGDLRTQFVQAYAKIEANYNAALVVPIFPGTDGSSGAVSGFASDLRNHVVSATVDGFGRVGILGVPANYGATQGLNAPGIETIAQDPAVSHKRLIVAYPNRLNLFNGFTNQTIEVDGFYFAAGCAGRLAAGGVQEGLTRKGIAGFSGLPASVTKLQTRSFKDNLSSKGVLVAEVDRQNRFIVRHGLSSDTSSVLTREISITRARDFLFEALQIGLDNSGLIGSPITGETTIRVKGAVQGILDVALNRGVFIAYSDIAVRQQVLPSGDPSIIEVKFAYQPAVPLNYIKVSFSIDLSSGLTTLAAA